MKPEERDAIIRLSHDASTDSQAAIDPAGPIDPAAAPAESIAVSLAAWETEGGSVRAQLSV